MSDVLKDVEKKMTQAIEHLKKEYQALRTNRVNPHMLDDVKVEVYGAMTPIKGLGTITVQDRNLIITPFDPSTASAIVKTIQQSSLKLNPIQEKTMIRIPVPPLNEELRKDIAKQAKQKMEQSKTVVRDIRKHGNDTIREEKKKGTITEDAVKGLEKKIQDLTDIQKMMVSYTINQNTPFENQVPMAKALKNFFKEDDNDGGITEFKHVFNLYAKDCYILTLNFLFPLPSIRAHLSSENEIIYFPISSMYPHKNDVAHQPW